MVDFIKKSWLVVLSSLVFGLLVAAVHGQLEGKIAENARLKLQRELKAMMGDGATFDREETYFVGKDPSGNIIGYAVQTEGGGFADKIVLLVSVDQELEKLLGIAVLKSNETPGFGDKIKNEPFKGQFKNSPAQKLVVVKTGDREKIDSEIVAITGATISSEAVAKIVNDAVLEMKDFLKKQIPLKKVNNE